MTTYRFQQVKTKATRRGKCPSCGKSVARTRVFMNTVNPFNRNADGVPKSYGEVFADVRDEAAAWAPSASYFEHDACIDARQDAAS